MSILENKKIGMPFLAVLLILSIFTSVGSAGGLKGKLKNSKEFTAFFKEHVAVSSEGKGNYYWLIENAVLPILPPVPDWTRDFVVALMKKGNKPNFDKIQTVLISGAMLTPSTIIVPPKTTIKFKNEDPFVHSLYSHELGMAFAPEILPSRQLRQVQFINPGVYVVRCKMTPHLTGYVIVDSDAVEMMIPAADGTFANPAIAPGKYQLKVYFEGQVVGSKDIEIADEKTTLEVEIEIIAPEKVGGGGKANVADSKMKEVGKEGQDEEGEESSASKKEPKDRRQPSQKVK